MVFAELCESRHWRQHQQVPKRNLQHHQQQQRHRKWKHYRITHGEFISRDPGQTGRRHYWRRQGQWKVQLRIHMPRVEAIVAKNNHSGLLISITEDDGGPFYDAETFKKGHEKFKRWWYSLLDRVLILRLRSNTCACFPLPTTMSTSVLTYTDSLVEARMWCFIKR